jgi:hypothetical protein
VRCEEGINKMVVRLLTLVDDGARSDENGMGIKSELLRLYQNFVLAL